MRAQDAIKFALKKVGAYGRGRPLSGEDAAENLEELNYMLDAWALDTLTIYYDTREALTLLIGTNPQTLGPTGGLVTARPSELLSVYIDDSGGTSHEVGIIERPEYDRIPSKGVPGRPERVYYNPTHPNGTLYFDLVPETAEILNLASRKPLTAFADLDTDYDLPPGYKEPIIYNLAIRLAANKGKTVPPAVSFVADTSLSFLKAANDQGAEVELDSALLPAPPYNINAD